MDTDLQIDLTTILIFVFELDHVVGIACSQRHTFKDIKIILPLFAIAIVMMRKDSVKDSLHFLNCLMSKPNQTS